MADEAKKVETPATESNWSSKWDEIRVTWRMAEPITPIWIIKLKNGQYIRVASDGKLMVLADRRLATRWGSRVWATTIAGFLPAEQGARVRRLWTKSEREASKAAGTVWRKSTTKTPPQEPGPTQPESQEEKP